MTRFEVKSVLQSAPYLVLIVFSACLLFVGLAELEVNYGVSAYPITRLMVEGIQILKLPLLVVAVFYSADIVWRERSVDF